MKNVSSISIDTGVYSNISRGDDTLQLGNSGATFGSSVENSKPDVSKWVGFNLSQSTFYQDYLSGVATAGDFVKRTLKKFSDVLGIFKAIVEVLKNFVVLTTDTFALLSKALKELLKQFKDALILLLNDVMNLGFYIYPQFVNYDWVGAISRELLTPYGISVNESQEILENQPKFISVPDPVFPGQTKFQFQAATKNGFGIDRFIEDIKIALNNKNDLMRPDFSRSMDISGIVLAVGIDDVFSLLRLVIEVISFMSGKEYALQFARWVAKIIAPILATSEQRNIGDPRAIQLARRFLSDVSSGKLDSIYSSDISAIDVADGVSLIVDVSKYQDIDNGDLCAFAVTGNDISFVNQPTREVFGNYRDNRLKYNIALASANVDVGVYVQSYLGGIQKYNSGEGFSRGIRVMTVAGGQYGENNFVLPLEETSGFSPVDFSVSGWKGVLPGNPTAPNDGDYYLNSTTEDITYYKDGYWQTAISPNIFEIRLYNESSGEIIGEPIKLYVPRFYVPDETITATNTRYDTTKKKTVTETITANYNYNDNYALATKASLTFSHTSLINAAGFFNITAHSDETERELGLPLVGNSIDLRPIDYTFGEKISSKIRLNILGNISENSSVTIIVNGKASTISLRTFGVSKDYVDDGNQLDFSIVDYSNGKLIVDVTADLFDGLCVIEVVSGTQTNVVPSGVTSGTYSTYSYYAFSKPQKVEITRNRKGQLSNIIVLSPNEVRTGKSNTAVDFATLAVNLVESLKRTPATTVRGGVFWTGDSEQGITKAKAKYYFRGSKNNGAGVLIVDKNNNVVHLTPPNNSGLWADLQNAPQLLEAGTYNYSVYAIDKLFVSFVHSSISGALPLTEKINRMLADSSLSASAQRYLTHRIFHTVVVTSGQNADFDPQNSNWYVMNFKQWFDFIAPLDDVLTALVDSVPVVNLEADNITEVLNALALLFAFWQKVLKKIRAIVDQILKFFDFGKTGMYALAIRGAAGNEGYTYRIEHAEVMSDLAKVPYVTGVAFVAPKYFGGDALVSTVFNWLPQEPLPNEPSLIGRLDAIEDFANSIADQVVSSAEKWATDSWNSIEDKIDRLKKDLS